MITAQVSQDEKFILDRLRPGRRGTRDLFSRIFRRAATALSTALIGMALVSNSASADVAGEAEIQCLALAIYFEARGEALEGRHAVGHVVMNRVSDGKFPDNICSVTRQGGERPRYRCQFSFWCDSRSDDPKDVNAWSKSQIIAERIYWGFVADPTDGALWYHADYVAPVWGSDFKQVGKIGRHIFYQRHEHRNLTRVFEN